jgi:hypothetical protein
MTALWEGYINKKSLKSESEDEDGNLEDDSLLRLEDEEDSPGIDSETVDVQNPDGEKSQKSHSEIDSPAARYLAEVARCNKILQELAMNRDDNEGDPSEDVGQDEESSDSDEAAVHTSSETSTDVPDATEKERSRKTIHHFISAFREQKQDFENVGASRGQVCSLGFAAFQRNFF